MERPAFEDMEILRREHVPGVGGAELCRREDGATLVRLRVWDVDCQRACLSGELPRRARLERGVLELLYPAETGTSLKEWLFTQEPTLGARRDACLALLAQCLEERAPPCVLALSARVENLRFSGRGARLVYLADWGKWSGELTAAHSVRSVAKLCGDILTRGLPRGRIVPAELELLRRRIGSGGYERWETLHRDIAALPDALPSGRQRGARLLRDGGRMLARFCKPAFCLATAAALLLALASLATEAARRQSERAGRWRGLTGAAGETWGETP